MTSIHPLISSYERWQPERNIQPVDPSAHSADTTRQPTPSDNLPQRVLESTRSSREGGVLRAEQRAQRLDGASDYSGRSRLAIAAYRSLDEREERDSISALMGVNEYA